MARVNRPGNSVENAQRRIDNATGGKPGAESKYDPRFCDVVVRMGGSGASETEMAVNGCGVVRATMRRWAKEHAEFGEALSFAREASLAWWETTGRARLRTQGFNTHLYNKIISSRFRADYSDRIVHSSDPDEPVITRIERRIVRPRDRNS